MPKRTYQPKIRRRMRVHGFRQRMATADGREVLRRIRQAGNWTPVILLPCPAPAETPHLFGSVPLI